MKRTNTISYLLHVTGVTKEYKVLRILGNIRRFKRRPRGRINKLGKSNTSKIKLINMMVCTEIL